MISICTPTYEMNGKGRLYLDYSFNLLYQQTYKDFEIIISDHSLNNDIKDLCEQWESLLNIKYIKNEDKRGSMSGNLNNTIKNATGDIIKVLFQDDFLYNENSLYDQLTHFEGRWLITACCHYNDIELYKPHYPQYHNNIQYGQNTISSPSVLMFENKDVIEFDENLLWLMDVDYYKRLYNKFGLPTIINNINVVIREHQNQVSNTLATQKLRDNELKYIVKKYENI